jgi:hypothetical protein
VLKFKCQIPVPKGLHAANLRHGTDGFTSPPKEGMLWIFSLEKSDGFGRVRTRDLEYQRPVPVILVRFYRKVKQSHYRPEQAQRLDRGIALPVFYLGTRSGCVVSITPRPLYPQERSGTICTGGCVSHRTDLDVCEKSRPNRYSIPRPSSP